ncbi:MAG: hypothetical protein IK141_01945 [Clostridia bacterium]|nr:hypothetical protein [Clostridia bacterium]
MIDIRFRLTDYLKKFGGHIGDSVAPSERQKGYATQMLGMALQLLKKSGSQPYGSPACREMKAAGNPS